MNKSLFTLSIILVVFISFYSSVRAANFNVGTEVDLVAAINTANVNGEGDTINLSGNITLTNALPDILADGGNILSIIGNGFTITRSGGAGNFRILYVETGATLTLSNITISNGISDTDGGGIYNLGSVTLDNSTLIGNQVANNGGAIWNFGTMAISNSTLSGNRAANDGGAILNQSGTLSITNSTFSNNVTFDDGGGIYHNVGTFTVRNSIVAGNTAAVATTECGLSANGTFTTNANNLFGINGTGGGCLVGANDSTSNSTIGAILNPLADNGGATQTHALPAGSPAIDNSGGGATVSDQRGSPVVNTRDIGAYEYDGVVPSVSFTIDETVLTEGGSIIQATVTMIVQDYFANFDVYFLFSGSTDDSDYTTTYAGSYTTTANGDTTFTIDIVDDGLPEGIETLILELFVIGTADILPVNPQQIRFQDTVPVVQATPIENAPDPEIGVFDPAISKLGFLLPGEIGVTGETLEWVVTVSNTGSVPGDNVTITDTLIDALQINSVDAPGGTVTINGQTVTVVYATLNVGEAVQFSIFTTVLDGVEVNNTACVTADNQSVEECATGGALRELPQTGESSWWHNWILLFSGLMILLSGGLLFIRYRHPVQ